MARDLFHEIVKESLINDGWRITHDPYEIKEYDPAWEIDMGAERMIAAERISEKIAVEVKSFLESSFAHEFHGILGQYLNYRSGLQRVEAERKLYLAVPLEIYETEFRRIGIVNSLDDYGVNLFIYDPFNQSILEWQTWKKK
jgi:hypothetical protein